MFIMHNNMSINLKNVVSVKFENNKIIFNYNYSISLNGVSFAPDYTYIYVDSPIDRENIRQRIENNNFISFKKSDNYNTLVNLDQVSFIKEYVKCSKDKYNDKYRLIFNLCVGSTLKGTNNITSNAVYYDFLNNDDLEEAYDSIQF